MIAIPIIYIFTLFLVATAINNISGFTLHYCSTSTITTTTTSTLNIVKRIGNDNDDNDNYRTMTKLNMGFFDGLSKAFSNEEYSAPPEGVKATARHILVKEKGQINLVLNELQREDTTFQQVAREYSSCPSGKSSGGSLGSFAPGTMVKEFDEVIFDPNTNLGEIVGPVQTQFGYHFIVVDKRTGV